MDYMLKLFDLPLLKFSVLEDLATPVLDILWVNEEKRELFFRYWVLKESFLKATRMGLSLGMDSFEIGFSDEDKPYLMDKPQTFWEEYYFREYAVDGLPYRIAVCADCKDFAPKIRVATL